MPLLWHIVHTRPHCEHVVARHLATRGWEHYLPMWRPAGTRGDHSPRPFFPCYLFVRVDLDFVGRWALHYAPGVRALVYAGDEPGVLQPSDIERIKRGLAEMERRVLDGAGEVLGPGDPVQVVAGPLAGLEAVFQRGLSDSDRVLILVDFLSKGAHLQIARQDIRRVPQASRLPRLRPGRIYRLESYGRARARSRH